MAEQQKAEHGEAFNPTAPGEGQYPLFCRFVYERTGTNLRISTRGLTNHELRDLLTGFWLVLTDADRADHIEELRHYLDDPSNPPEVSAKIAAAVKAAR